MMIPKSRPQQTKAKTKLIIERHGVNCPVCLVGIRGYYSETFPPAGNQINVYDDCILLISQEAYVTFNANTDPAAKRKGIATLNAGVWQYKLGIHGLSKPENRRYEALVQAAMVTVHREGQGNDTGFFGINIHKGGYNTTSSLGCQTIYPDQWLSFITLVKGEMKRAGVKTIPYLLTEQS